MLQERVGASTSPAAGRDVEPPALTDPPYNRMVVSMTPHRTPTTSLPPWPMPPGVTSSCGRSSGREGVAELAGHYPMSFAAVQKHIAVLERAGLVTKERTGRRKVVQTNIEGLSLARGLLDQYEALWRGRVERMTNLITSSEEIDHDRHRRPQGPQGPDDDPDRRVRRDRRRASGSCGPIRASSSAGGARRPTRPRSPPTTWRPAATSSTT